MSSEPRRSLSRRRATKTRDRQAGKSLDPVPVQSQQAPASMPHKAPKRGRDCAPNPPEVRRRTLPPRTGRITGKARAEPRHTHAEADISASRRVPENGSRARGTGKRFDPTPPTILPTPIQCRRSRASRAHEAPGHTGCRENEAGVRTPTSGEGGRRDGLDGA